MLIVWLIALVVGVALTGIGSRRAVMAALDCTDALGVSAGVVGVSIMAIGTDLPEIANSIIASASGHGDLNVGDSTGSSMTQVTLVLAILLATTGLSDDIQQPPRLVAPTGIATVIALVAVSVLVEDGHFGRLDGLLLLAGWLGSLLWIGRRERKDEERAIVLDSTVLPPVLRALGWLGVVGGAAAVIVRAFIELTEAVGAPEFIASAVVLALGTSLPELVVDWTAIRSGAAALAIGDLFGSSLVDATLSVGIGPTFRPTAISAAAATGSLIVAAAVGVATVLVVASIARRQLAGSLVATYVGATAGLLLVAA